MEVNKEVTTPRLNKIGNSLDGRGLCQKHYEAGWQH